MKIYDEDEAVAFIRNHISDKSVSDEDILDVIDSIFNYYDENGDLDLDFDEDLDDEPDSDIEAIISAVSVSLCDSNLSPQVIREIVGVELDYEDSLL